ncbi:MAG: PP2C family protein-serine/threonine phosphatase [Leptospirales bacterium]
MKRKETNPSLENIESGSESTELPSSKEAVKHDEPVFFKREEKMITQSLEITANSEYKDNPIIEQFQNLTLEYQRLLKQAKKLVKMSDSQQLNLSILSEEKAKAYNKINELYKAIMNDLNFAQKIQNDILPKNIERYKGIDIGIKFLPMIKVGGDIYDIVKIGDNTIRIFLADAIGHGVQAALITMLIKSEYDMVRRKSVSPAESFDFLNTRFMKLFVNLNLFFTGIIIDIDLVNRKICFASAGHPTQYLLHKQQLVKMEHAGSAIGIISRKKYGQTEYSFESNDKLFLFTDGVIEQANAQGEEYGEDRLEDIIQKNIGLPATEIKETIFSDIDGHLNGIEPDDDITFLDISIG